MSGTRADARKRTEQQRAWDREEWSPSEVCCDQHARVLVALRAVYGTADLGEAVALADALDDAGFVL